MKAPLKSIQIHHNGALHWICSRIDTNQSVFVYDSLFHKHTTEEIDTQLALLYDKDKGNLSVTVVPVQQQRGPSDCGLFAAAVCTALAAGEDTTLLRRRQDKMRAHMIRCLESEIVTPFPTIQSQRLRSKIILNVEHRFVVKLWCYCRLPTYSYKFMLECQQCKGWCHKPCIGLRDTDITVTYSFAIHDSLVVHTCALFYIYFHL